MDTVLGSDGRKRSADVGAPGMPVRSALFQGLSAAELEELFASGTDHRAQRHQVLFCAGEELTELYFVQRGSLKLVYHSPEGRELIVCLVGPGECCGPFAEPADSATLAQALEDTLYTRFPLAALRGAIVRNPALARNFLTYAQRVHSEADAATARLAFQGVPQRLAHLLTTETDHSTGELSFPLTQTEMANLIGSSRETVCSLLGQFRKQGLVRMERGRVRVVDRAGLTAIE
jgi:CRP/FNR family cyclic AMP-dependent transcriptional regulator